jgi:hypothetical protein
VTLRILIPALCVALAAACSRDQSAAPAPTDANGWMAVFVASTDTIFLDTASVARAGEGVYHAWFRSTRNPGAVHEETDCARRRTRSIGSSPLLDHRVVRHEDGAWEDVPSTGRSASYFRNLCDRAPTLAE